MKKLITFLAAASLMMLGTQAHAQLVVGAGYLHSIEKDKYVKSDEPKPNVEHLNGFYAGASYNFRFGTFFGVAPGFYLNMLFQDKQLLDYNSQALNYSARSRYTEIALNLPIKLTFNFEINDNLSTFAYVGPNFQYGVFARSTVNKSGSVLGINLSKGQEYNHYGEKGDTNPFNIYMGAGAGVQVGDIQFMIGYDHNLLNCTKVTDWYSSRNQIKAGVNFVF